MTRILATCFMGCLLAAPPTLALDIDIGRIADMVGKTVEASRDVSEEQERRIGDGLAASLLGAAPLVDDAEVQRYVNRVGQWVAMQTERAGLPWRFGVIDTDTVNAFAAPGGYVFVTRGLLLAMRNEAELAGVLAHEMVHVLRRHHLEAIKSQARLQVASDVARMLAEDEAGTVDLFVNAGMELYARGLDRDDEFEADRLGVVIAARAGYEPFGLPTLLMTLDAMDPGEPALALMLGTHPSAADRLARLDAVMDARLEPYAKQPQVAKRFLRAKARVAARKKGGN